MMKSACPKVFVLLLSCFCGTANADEPLELPPFEPATVTVEGVEVSVEVRCFDPRLVLGATDPASLPDGASRSVIAAWQAFAAGADAEFVAASVDPEQAERFAQAIGKKADEERAAWFKKALDREVEGEMRVGDVTLVVAVSGEGEDADRAVYVTTLAEGKSLLIAVPYYLLDEVDGLKEAVALSGQLRSGGLALETLVE